MIPERLHGLFPQLPPDPNTLFIRQEDGSLLIVKKGGGRYEPLLEKPLQPKQGKDLQYIVVKQMNRPTRSGK